MHAPPAGHALQIARYEQTFDKLTESESAPIHAHALCVIEDNKDTLANAFPEVKMLPMNSWVSYI
jgi:hypothetical protein